MNPVYKISYIRETTKEEINKVVEQINRALLDIYSKANSGVFSGVALTAYAANTAGAANALAGTPLINGVSFNGTENITVDIGVTTSTRVNGHYLNADVTLVPFDIGIDNFTSSLIAANGYVLVDISGVNYKFLAGTS